MSFLSFLGFGREPEPERRLPRVFEIPDQHTEEVARLWDNCFVFQANYEAPARLDKFRLWDFIYGILPEANGLDVELKAKSATKFILVEQLEEED